MLTRLVDRVARRRGACRSGHQWTDRAYPIACSVCGRSPGRSDAVAFES